MTETIFSHFDDKLNNILKIKETHLDEACILIFAYLDYLSNFTLRKHSDDHHNKANFRHFLMEYSGKAEILKCIEVAIYINHMDNPGLRERYGKYMDRIVPMLEKVRDGAEIPVTHFLHIDAIDEADKDYFRKITIVNRLYEFRNFAVHEYRNKFEDGLDDLIPVVSYVENTGDSSRSWFEVLYSFEFMYEILMNCYQGVRKEYGDFIGKHYPELLQEGETL